MQIYNSATHTKEEFVPHVPGKVSMYTCGPTVYHFAHIGNLRTYMMEESALHTKLLTRHAEGRSDLEHTRICGNDVGDNADEFRTYGCAEVTARSHEREHNHAARRDTLGNRNKVSGPKHGSRKAGKSASDKTDYWT